MIFKDFKNRIAIDNERAIFLWKSKEPPGKIKVTLIDEDAHMGGSSRIIGIADDLTDVKQYLIDNLNSYPAITFDSLHSLELTDD
jgi:hypothetical protein